MHTAQYSAYLLAKAKGAPIEFVFPEEGLTLTPGVLGVVAEAPHPNAAQLFMDWFLSVPGQKVYDEISSLNSPRDGCATTAGRHAARQGQVAVSEGLAGVPGDARSVREGLEQSHRRSIGRMSVCQ